MSTIHMLHQRHASSVWSGLTDSYNAARLVIAALATISAGVVGVMNGWPRGPWVLIVSLSIAIHALVYRSQRGQSQTVLLVIDALALSVATFAMGIVTVALPALALMLIVASVLETGMRTYALWAFDVFVIGLAMLLNRLLDLPLYTASQEGLSERVGLVFFALASVAMTRTLANRLRRIDEERRETRQRLSSHDNRYRAMLAYSSDGLAVTDAGLRIVELGVQNQRLTGYSAAERIGASMLDLVIDEDRGALLEAYNRVVRMPDEPARFKVRIRRRDGEVRLMNATARNLLNDPDLEGFVFNFHDVTEEHELRRSLELFGVTPDADVSL